MLYECSSALRKVTIPLKETVVEGEDRLNYYGAVTIPFSFGEHGKFQGSAFVNFSVTRKAAKTVGK